MTEKAKNKGGRPRKYTKKWADDQADGIPNFMKGGASIAELCVKLEISKDTFYRCKKQSERFSDAIKKGLTYSEAWWMDIGQKAALGEITINATTWIYNVKNRFKWRDAEKETVKIDFSDCDNNLKRMQRVLDLASTGQLSLEDAMQYKMLIKTVVDEEIIETLNRIKKLDQGFTPALNGGKL